jgi:HNH endonuclease
LQQDMSALNPPAVTQKPIDPFSLPRSQQWPEVQRACLEKSNYTCAACGIQGQGLIQVHHIIPFQYCVVYGRQELEFNPKNLIPLCEGPNTNDHHIALGHLGDFQHLNQDVLTDIKGPWKALARAAIEILPDFLARKRWPVKPVSADDQAALIALMNQWYGPKPAASIDELIQQWYGFKSSKQGTVSSGMSNNAPTPNANGS